jgi:hypothetical protein
MWLFASPKKKQLDLLCGFSHRRKPGGKIGRVKKWRCSPTRAGAIKRLRAKWLFLLQCRIKRRDYQGASLRLEVDSNCDFV